MAQVIWGAAPAAEGAVELVARCLRGLESICAAELGGGFGARVLATEHRLVYCRARLDPSLLRAGTVDDLFVVAARFTAIDHRRSALEELRLQVLRSDPAAAVAEAGALRPVARDAPFEVVASFLGRRNYNRFEIERAVGEALERATGRSFLPGPHAADTHPPLSWRVHLHDAGGFLGLRLSDGPLHRRAYRLRSQEGTLHPPLAYAAAMLASPPPDVLVLDPFCGSGTMLLEAVRLQPSALMLGADIRLDAVRTAAENAGRQGHQVHWMVCDAAALAVRSSVADVVLTNPPWHRRLELTGGLRQGLAPFWSEADRVLTPAGRAVLVLEDLEEQLPAMRMAGLEPVLLQRVAVSGTWTSLGLVAPAGRREAELERLAAAGLRAADSGS
jgi:tRNA (guanine6-N2)-methyltransferase